MTESKDYHIFLWRVCSQLHDLKKGISVVRHIELKSSRSWIENWG